MASVLVVFSVVPLLIWAVISILDRYFPDTDLSVRTWAVVAISGLASLYFALQCYRSFCKFSPHRHTLHPAFIAPRICLFLELHPVWGLFLPVTSMLRGFHVFAFMRWALNFTSIVLFLINSTMLAPAWREACCYGAETLADDQESCESVAFSNTRGMSVCSEKSPTHENYEKIAYALIAVSGALQLCNVMTITWSVMAQIERLVAKTAGGKFRIVGHEDETINWHMILRLMGMPMSVEKQVFDNSLEGESDEDAERRVHRLHHHPHWCQSGLYRLLALDPLFGYTLSLHDFLGYTNMRGTLRILANFIGASLIVLSVEVLQPMHYAWCCYGTGSYTENHVLGEHYTCEEWVMRYYGPEQDRRIPSPFSDSETFPNGSCLRHHSIGLGAALSFFGGFALLFVSTMVWVYSVESAGDAEKRAARRLFRRVIPAQRYLLLQAMDLMGIQHGMIHWTHSKSDDEDSDSDSDSDGEARP